MLFISNESCKQAVVHDEVAAETEMEGIQVEGIDIHAMED